VGFMERGGRVRTQIVEHRRKYNMQPLVREHVQTGAALYTDALKSYIGLDKHYEHEVIDHAFEYVRGNDSHKRHRKLLVACEARPSWNVCERGTVSSLHLYRYLDEQMFRFNNRKNMHDGQRFELGMSQVLGKRLTYSELTGKDESPRHEATGAGETPIPF
jgi:ISXO2 transposase-like protein